VLKESHRFYFIPTSTMGVLSKPEIIGFWENQRRSHANRKFVVVLEDSDAAPMTRASDNREQVSAILNLSDGMLADFLRLEIICTINYSAADIDPALLRPGCLFPIASSAGSISTRQSASPRALVGNLRYPVGSRSNCAAVNGAEEEPRWDRLAVNVDLRPSPSFLHANGDAFNTGLSIDGSSG
jgi:hypothetical protein